MRLMIGSLLASLAVAFAVPACAVDNETPDESTASAELTTVDNGTATNKVCRQEPGQIGFQLYPQFSACMESCGSSSCRPFCCQQVTGCLTCVVL